MRFLSLQSPAGRPHVRMLYEELAKHGILVDAVVAPVKVGKADHLIREERGFSGIFAHDGWIVPLVESAVKRGMCVVVFLRTLQEWYTLEESGLVRQVDLFVFEDYATYNQLNRNLNYVVVEDFTQDAAILVTLLTNITRHHKYRRPSVERIRKDRKKTSKLVKQICKSAYDGEEPSFTEIQYFLDAMHSDNERQRLILNLRALLARQASVREIRGLANPPKRTEPPPELTPEQAEEVRKRLMAQIEEAQAGQEVADGP